MIIPVLFPDLKILCFQLCELFLRHQEWITAPLIPVIVSFGIFILHMVGTMAIADRDVILCLSQSGEMIYLAIVSDCTGIWSLGTFIFAILIVAYSFEGARTRDAGLAHFIVDIDIILANHLQMLLSQQQAISIVHIESLEASIFHVGSIVFFARKLHFNPFAPLKKDNCGCFWLSDPDISFNYSLYFNHKPDRCISGFFDYSCIFPPIDIEGYSPFFIGFIRFA